MKVYPVRSARIVQLIEVIETTGEGTPENPTRTTQSYWTPSGRLLFREDHLTGEMDNASSNVSSESM